MTDFFLSYLAPILSLVRFSMEGTENGFDIHELILDDHNSHGILNVTCNAEQAAVAEFGDCRQIKTDEGFKVVIT